MQLERRPAVTLKIAKCEAALAGVGSQLVRPKMIVQQCQDLEFQARDAAVVDVIECAQACEHALESGAVDARARRFAVREIVDRLDIEIEHVQRGAIRGTVRACRLWPRRKEGMQRVDTDEIGAGSGCGRKRVAQVGEVADSPVAMRTQRVELQGEAPDPGTAGQRRRAVATRRRDDQLRRCEQRTARMIVNGQPVIPAARRQRDLEHVSGVFSALTAAGDGPRHSASLERIAGFPIDPPVDREGRGVRRRDPQRDRTGTLVGDDDRRQQRACAAIGCGADGIGRCRGDVDAHSPQQCEFGFFRCPPCSTPGILVAGGDAVAFTQALEWGAIAHVRASGRRSPASIQVVDHAEVSALATVAPVV